ncbi:protein ENL isoform X3 [Homo sapiens]|uniref:protein ENL isoform X3 n=1 Tax=Homo sapiens TaxID=9606 RepID=UPI0005CFFD3F|nr:protein ENL isoform X3 [Homo sapiens]XP_054177019.1 protein ENL isoform X3 [Homo sapiens]|eukprot:XP_011526325.1 protein ENL isoform X3 [Homo sapiens]
MCAFPAFPQFWDSEIPGQRHQLRSSFCVCVCTCAPVCRLDSDFKRCTVQVRLELGHRAQLRKKPTTEGFTHDWMVFVRGPEQCDIQHFVEKVVFWLHDSFPKPRRVCKEPPYKVEESGYAGFIMPIEVHFKNKEEPRKVCFTYDLFLNLEGNPPVNHLRCEKLTFNNPTTEFRYKLLRAGGDANKESSKTSKPHKVTKEHRERPRKDSESKSSSKELEREQAKSSKDTSRKLGEGRLPKEEKAPPPKAAFKEPKMALKETKLESTSPKGGPPPPPPPPPRASSKRPATADSPKPSAKKQKKSSSKGSRSAPGTSPRTSSSSSFSDKKPAKDKSSTRGEKVKAESEPREAKKALEVEESNSEDEASFKSESAQSSPSNSSSSSDSSSDSDFEPSQNHSQGPLRSMVEDLQSEESDEDDSSSGEEAAGKTNPGRDSRLSFSDSESDNSADSSLPSREPPPPQKPPPPNSKVSGRRSPESCSKPEKILKKGTYDKAYTDELVELHRRLMALRERNVLQQIVNLIEETGHFNVTNTTFDFDLFSLDETTVRKLQSCLEAVAT